jgi:hypothetical protein
LGDGARCVRVDIGRRWLDLGIQRLDVSVDERSVGVDARVPSATVAAARLEQRVDPDHDLDAPREP